MAISRSLYSSRSEEWATPQNLFEILDREFHFTLDACATSRNAKCPRYYTKQEDGLSQDWSHERVFCNPPYGKAMLAWARKAVAEHHQGALVVMVAHARTDTRWWAAIAPHCRQIRFVVGRESKMSAPFPSAVLILDHPRCGKAPELVCWRYRAAITFQNRQLGLVAPPIS
jgi:site-specific DNA-methyltransferase (adenine-specific)